MISPTAAPERLVGHTVVDGSALGLDDRRYYAIESYEVLPPFLMTVVGASDIWLFLSSTGGLTAGRRDADGALFPYYTEDKVAEGAAHTGGLTELRVRRPDGTSVWWRPFAELRPGDAPVARTLYKDFLGTSVVFEEARADLGLRLRVAWQTSARYGVVRTCQLGSTSQDPVTVDVLDGLRNLLPAGATAQVQNELSILLDAYKRAELDAPTGLGLYYLNSTLTDLAEASESLQASVAWQVGLPGVGHLLYDRQLPALRAGGSVCDEDQVRGERGSYLVRTEVTLEPGVSRTWRVVADVGLSAADVVGLREDLTDPEGLAARLEADIESTRRGLEVLVGSADGAQLTGDEIATAHHGANVLFNAMRGGVPVHGYRLRADDVRAFVRTRSPRTAQRCAEHLAALPPVISHEDLLAAAEASGDVDLWRLCREYLPLTFSRRHGDPSRPWNAFRIALRDADGRPSLDYQGNWRDIFQNWEALAWSFPEYVESMVAVFVDATTADGYNPYRISRDGIDWEVPEPGNPWANIGYWSDHQLVYLAKLLETSERFHPGRLRRLTNRTAFTHADVPYRIASYEQTVQDPSSTIEFDASAAQATADRVAREGADGRLVHGADGDLVRVTLGEKLLVLMLAKVVNLVPEGGIWMNTQRPEWNDANNALVGRGLSVVTLAYLRRYLGVVRPLLDEDLEVGVEAARLLTRVAEVLEQHAAGTVDGFDDVERRRVVDALGAAGSDYRESVYHGVSGESVTVARAQVHGALDLVLAYVDSGLRANRRADGLYHSYNVLRLGPGRLTIGRLQEMLEGQVAALSSGLLTPAEALDVLRTLRGSALYRADQHSYMLYPDRDLPRFLEKNRLTPEQVARCPLVDALVHEGDRSVVVRDARGDHHFAPAIHNARDVADALERLRRRAPLGADDRLAAQVEAHGATLLEVFEEVFRHSEFTGRSGSFFAYEGLGSIYWHMVSKLLLAAQETLERAVAEGADPGTIDGLRGAYEDVRQGLGYCKPPEVYGAFPVDPYSHTPGGKGARQPGMTGQVKEEVLTRAGELGLRVEGGAICFRPVLLRPEEWTSEPAVFRFVDVAGRQRDVELPAGSLAFTFCQVPVIYERGARMAVRVRTADGSESDYDGGTLPLAVSTEVFRRSGHVLEIRVTGARA
ncbi:hypothetical protein Q6346_14630 [Isoptericola sp. b490]|uniref:hypothetical protein n=1 Tax=Actinotalea lenta TaxID=3064654 RepID=UPI002713A1B5|nr:hypothetical protein [Isoptericola sp. b490]MDO8122545.1 hypothetical protein [Isoptericola sp. b490]